MSRTWPCRAAKLRDVAAGDGRHEPLEAIDAQHRPEREGEGRDAGVRDGPEGAPDLLEPVARGLGHAEHRRGLPREHLDADARGLGRIRRRRFSEFGIGKGTHGQRVYEPAQPGTQSLPGLVVFRFDAQLFYANANRFVDDVKAVFSGAPDPVRWLVLDCSAIDDIDYSAGIALTQLVRFVHHSGAHFGIVQADAGLLATLETYGVLDAFSQDRVFPDLRAVFKAYAMQDTEEMDGSPG